MSRNIFTNNKKSIKNIAIFGGIALVLGTTISLVSCNAKNNDNNSISYSNSDDMNSNSDTMSSSSVESSTSEDNISNSNSNSESSSYQESSEQSSTSSSTTSVGIDNAEPVIIKLTADDVINLSTSYAEYVNKVATITHENYMFTEMEPTDLYPVAYLANIDNISKEETAKLIDGGFISDNINDNIAKSFYFYELYADDTINKIQSGKDDIIDLSLLFNKKSDIEAANIMNKIMTDSIKASDEETYKNYLDTVFYYVEGTDISGIEYDFSSSVYPTDRDKLSVGADYTLSYAASCIDEIAKVKGVATSTLSGLMYDARVDFSNISNVFKSCKLPDEQNKTLAK